MAPRRNNSGPSAIDVQNLFGLDTDHHLLESLNNNGNNNNDLMEPNMTTCCVPNTECLKSGDFGLINLDDLSDCIRVVCNNETCTSGNYMHRECFEAWEQTVLTYLKSNGRARSWSEKQRIQNLWTKKGYDLVFKACNCKCNRGHLRKDLDWSPPQSNSLIGRGEDDASKKKKKKNRNNQKPVLSLNVTPNVYHPNPQTQKPNGVENIMGGLLENTSIRGRANSLSSSNGSSSPPVSSSEQSISPVHSTPNAILKTDILARPHPPVSPRTLTEMYSDRVR